MPELPEVETVARSLRTHLVGERLGASVVRWRRTLGGLSPSRFSRAVRGAHVREVRRRGKFVVIDLARGHASGGALLVHLRMTGRLQIDPAGVRPGPWERVRIALEDGRVLRFLDVRKFGRVRWVSEAAEALTELGPEPLGDGLDARALWAALRSRRRRLKPLLLDQGFLAGLGNIYADEALHRAGLHPLVRSDRLGRDAAARLLRAIRSVLRAAIAREGSSFDSFYRTPEGRPGRYQSRFRVYGREGKPCLRCGTPIERILISQRSTRICPRCQRRPVRDSSSPLPSAPSRARRAR